MPNHPAAKAIAAFVVPLCSTLLLFLTGNETLADITTAEWVAVVLSVVGTPAAVYGVPNRPQPARTEEES